MSAPKGQPAESFAFEKIIYEKRDWRATVTINRAEVLNSFDFQTLKELERAFEDASWDDSVGVLILTGAGDRAFCTGADLREQEASFVPRPRDYWKWMGAFIDAHERLRNIGKPTIARLNGIVVGGGNEFNISCDLAVAADDITIRQIGTARGSVPAGGATQWLPLIIGDRRAREMIWLSEPIGARQALDWGLVNRVVPRDQLDAAVDELAQKLIEKLPTIMRYAKQQTNFWRDLSWGVTIGHARDWLAVHTAAWETYEGMTAFSEKRLPDYMMFRERAAAGESTERRWGAYSQTCQACGATGLPEEFRHCGVCGVELS
ncbi:MAG TPA: enoyl-CoA hydratase/isomerase family protein [Thermomicrobiales bacterium]|nr:enoyl-CoA hydratase/isomerase family protein [Thermomicrobiales bacterium]